MLITVQPGKYVAAVSGGVDSMVLLGLLHNLPDVELVVAHLDHGVRSDSQEDRKLVEATALAYGLPFEYKEAHLGVGVSEAAARVIRYAFLDEVRQRHGAQAIITAHHQDDVLETALLNMLRGTGRKGLSSLRSSDTIVRPLLQVPKQAIRAYAEEHAIRWREDSTKSRRTVLAQLCSPTAPNADGFVSETEFAERLLVTAGINEELDSLLLKTLQSHLTAEGLERCWFIDLPEDVSAEIMAAWLRSVGIRSFDRKAIARLVKGAKTALPGKRIEVMSGNQLHIGRDYVKLVTR